MSETSALPQFSVGPDASSPRNGAPIELVVVHSDPTPAAKILADLTDPTATAAPHYYVDAAGVISQLVPEDRAAHHSGTAPWNRRGQAIDPISIGITVEHTPGVAFNRDILAALSDHIAEIQGRYGLSAEAVRRWEPDAQSGAGRSGCLLPFAMPPVPVTLEFDAVPLLGATIEGSDEVTCVPFIPPADPAVLGGEQTDPAAQQRLLVLLAQETYRQRGEGFRSEWAFHRYALKRNFGAPLAPSSNNANQVSIGSTVYGHQVFAGDTVFNEIPNWTAVQSLNDSLDGHMPTAGLGRALLEATYTAGGAPLHTDWRFHLDAVAQRLGPPLTGSYSVSIGGREVNLQVFAGDTLYSFPPDFATALRLSATEPGPLRDALWAETYKPSGATYDANAPFQQRAAQDKLGAPLTGSYPLDFEGTAYTAQVFTRDTVYAGPDGVPLLMSALPKPDDVSAFEPTTMELTLQALSIRPGSGSADDALSDRQPAFMMLPLAGQPRISQFYGFTKYSRRRTDIYSATQARHSGLDFLVPEGTPLLSVSHGVVLCAGQGCPFGASQPGSIVVRYGSIYAVYGHARSARVRKGQIVAPGNVLGESGSYVAPHLHFELRPVPKQILGNRDANQNPVNPGTALNPIIFFSNDLRPYFEQQYGRLIGGEGEFCVGNLNNQPDTTFGGPIDQRPCTN